jgi:hypothetical protein
MLLGKNRAQTLVSCYVDPLYGAKPNIIFDKKIELSCQSFWEKYGIYNEGITPKRPRIGKETEEDEIVTLFGPCSSIGYEYYQNEDEALIAKVETLWMIMHQRTQVPNT